MLPIVGTAIRSWRDTFRALQRMPLMFGVALAALFIVDIAMMAVSRGSGDVPWIATQIKSVLQAGLNGIALAPLVIAMHRHVLLDEDGNNYAFNFRDRRFTRFVLAELAYTALVVAPPMAFLALWRSMDKGSAATIGVLFGLGVLIILALRLLILFPAIAVDAPGARWTNALADSKGLTWRLLSTVALVGLPTIALGQLYNIIPDTHSLGRIVSLLVLDIEQVFLVAAMAALASHFFRSSAERLIQP